MDSILLGNQSTQIIRKKSEHEFPHPDEKHQTGLDISPESVSNLTQLEIRQDKNEENNNFLLQKNLKSPNSELKLRENWRNKGEKENVQFNQTLDDTPISTAKNSKKCLLKIRSSRNTSHFSRPYQDYKRIHKTILNAQVVGAARDLLLRNSS